MKRPSVNPSNFLTKGTLSKALTGCLVILVSSAGSLVLAQTSEPCPVGDSAVREYLEWPEEKRSDFLEAFRTRFSDALRHSEQQLKAAIEGTPILLESRLKTPESLAEKITRPGKDYRCFSYVTDVAGLRLVIPDYAALPFAEDIIRQYFEVLSEQELLSDTRDSGYRAVHYLVRVNGRIAEIQLQTVRGLLWADFSHKFYYKGPFRDNAALGQYLHDLSDSIYQLDSGFQTILPKPPLGLPPEAREGVNQMIEQVEKIGRPDLGFRFLILEAGQPQHSPDILHLRLVKPFHMPSDYFSLDEFVSRAFTKLLEN